MRRLTALALTVLLAHAPLARAHDFYHDEYWHEDYDDHWHPPHVTASKLDMAWELYETGRHLANEHSLEEATKPIRQAIELEPRIARFHLTLGLILRDQGKRDEAVAELRLARKYGYGWVEEEAYWTLKDLGADPRYTDSSGPAAVVVSGNATAAGATGSLYERLGGGAAIAAVVNSFVDRVGRDGRINARFAKTDLPLLKKRLTQQIGQATGGPEIYEGKDMRTVHEGMKITDAEFTALVEDLVAALTEFKVPQKEQDELIAALASMKKDIVGI
jgi:hemoglobin